MPPEAIQLPLVEEERSDTQLVPADPQAPAPDDVPGLDPDIRGATTIREQLAKHRALPACASCHVRERAIIGTFDPGNTPHKTVKDGKFLSETLCIGCHNVVDDLNPLILYWFAHLRPEMNGGKIGFLKSGKTALPVICQKSRGR